MMIAARGILILFGGTLASLSSPLVNDLAQPSETGKTIQETGLLKLRKQLDLVRAKQREARRKPYDAHCCPDISFLLRLSKSEIQTALGEPNVCKETGYAPCKEIGAWFYCFYYLPPGWLGGGFNLVLQFDRQERCLSAKWIGTK